MPTYLRQPTYVHLPTSTYPNISQIIVADPAARIRFIPASHSLDQGRLFFFKAFICECIEVLLTNAKINLLSQLLRRLKYTIQCYSISH